VNRLLSNSRFDVWELFSSWVPMVLAIGIGARGIPPGPLPHHRTGGSASGGSES
jgi:hypothetical protein